MGIKLVGNGYKNKIINGDFSVKQRLRGGIDPTYTTKAYIVDRFYTRTDTANVFTSRATPLEAIGTMKDNTDPFGDGSLTNYWKINSNDGLNNLVGDVDGVTGGDPTYVDEGPFDGSIYLDGDGDYVKFSTNPFSSGVGSLVVFFKPDGGQEYNDVGALIVGLFDKDASTSGEENIFCLFIRTTDMKKLWMTINGDDIITQADTLTDGWNCLVVNFYGDYVITYINGTKWRGATIRPNLDLVDEITLGADWDVSGDYNNWFKGNFSNFMTFNRPLRDDEIQTLANMAKSANAHYSYTVRPLESIDTSGGNSFIPVGHVVLSEDLDDSKYLTLSFKVTSNRTGDYSLAIINKCKNNGYRTYLTKFNIPTAYEETYVSVTIDTEELGGFQDHKNTPGLEIVIAGMNNETYKSTTEGYQDGTFYTLDGTIIDFGKNDFISVREIQLESDPHPSDFTPLPYDANYLHCRRYYYNSGDEGPILYSGDCTENNTYFVNVDYGIPLVKGGVLSINTYTTSYFDTPRLAYMTRFGIRFAATCTSTGAARWFKLSFSVDAEYY